MFDGFSIKIALGIAALFFILGMIAEYKIDNIEQKIKENKRLAAQVIALETTLNTERNNYQIANTNANQLNDKLSNLNDQYQNVTQELENVKIKLDDTNRINTLFMRTISAGTKATKLPSPTAASKSISESATITSIQPSVAAKYIMDNFNTCDQVIIKYNSLIDFYEQIESNINGNITER